MVRITKTMQAKHSESLSPWIKEFRDYACSVALPLLPQHLSSFPSKWPFPRGDLYHWIPLLNRFDDVLEKFCKAYKLEEGPQVVDFGCMVLAAASDSTQISTNGQDISGLEGGNAADQKLLVSILDFSRMLLQNCGNRSIYASSAHLNSLLNSTSLSLLNSTLALASELAQRYQAALKRMNIPVRHVSNALLANHYNIDLDRVLQLAMPFSKTITTTSDHTQPSTPATPTVKGKEKSIFNGPTPALKGATTTIYANDLVSMVKGGNGASNSPKGSSKYSDPITQIASERAWADWGEVKVTYYPKKAPDLESSDATSNIPLPPLSTTAPATPTPVRRSSNLGPHGQRAGRQSNPEESPSTYMSSLPPSDDTPRLSYKTVEISAADLKASNVHALLVENASRLPQERQYELLTKLRVANALTTSVETRQQILAVRLLAITNLAYVHSETTFQDEVMKQDGDEPRRLQLVYQLAELVHPPAEGVVAVPRPLQTLAFGALDALSAHQAKFQDICSALNTTVNHGVLLYVVRKAVAEMSQEDSSDKKTRDDEWRDSLFSLLSNLSTNPRTAVELVTAGLIPILVEVLNLRTSTAERYHPKILQFLDTILYSARDAFQTLVNANGLDAVSDLIVFEVKSASDNAVSGKGIINAYRSTLVDYDVPYFQQQTLKWLFKFIHHMMSTAGGQGGNFDRLLRNLIDSSQLLSSLRLIIENARCFGSVVWTNAVSILNDFINNEPTSFAVIAEAGLSRGFLEAVTGQPIKMPTESKKPDRKSPGLPDDIADPAVETSPASSPSDNDDDDDDDESDEELYEIQPLTQAGLQASRELPLARGILPTSDTINIIPQAFGAICLNPGGMKMFQASKALETFFEIFESPEHVKCMDVNKELPSSLGSTFDELVRHHPPLKGAIMTCVLNMVARVNYLCAVKGEKSKIGAKLWTTDTDGKAIVADADITNSLVDRSVKGKGKAADVSSDTEMTDVESIPLGNSASQHISAQPPINGSMTPYIAAVATFLSAMFSNSSARLDFSLKGGIESVLDLASSPCLSYDFSDGTARRTIHQVIALLAESKPHLALPSLLRRAQSAANDLESFASHTEATCFFEPFVKPESLRLADVQFISQGTKFAKALVNIHSLVATINICFQTAQIYAHRSNGSNFTQINVADYYVSLVKSLGPLLASSLREDMKLQQIIPSHWKTAPRVKDTGFGDLAIDTSLTAGLPAGIDEPQPTLDGHLSSTINVDSSTIVGENDQNPSFSTASKTPTKSDLDSPCFKNYQTLRFLVSKMTRTISPFFQTLGKALVPKRNIDPFQKYTHITIAESLAQTMLEQLSLTENLTSIERYSYWNSLLQVLTDMLIEGASRTHERPLQTITLVLQAFKDQGGIEKLNDMLRTFTSEIRPDLLQPHQLFDESNDDVIRQELSTAGAKTILGLYAQIVNGKNIAEASQTMSIVGSRSDRELRRSDQFSSGQFVVELRVAVLPTVQELWESEVVEKGPGQISEKLIDVIRTICNADCELTASKRADKALVHVKQSRKFFKPTAEFQTSLHGSGYDSELANEALYRCNNNLTSALDYCRDISRPGSHRNSIPADDLMLAPEAVPPTSRPQTSVSTGTATPDDHVMEESALSGIISGLSDLHAPQSGPLSGPPDLGRLFAEFEDRNSRNIPDQILNTTPNGDQSVASQSTPLGDKSARKQVTVDDLNELREGIRENLIDKCLDVINAHGEVTFEVADLITTVVSKSTDHQAMRNSISETLVLALMSFAGEDDLRACGKKIAAYAHLLALMLRDKLFYGAALPNLTDNLSTLLSFVKLSPNHSTDEPSPWIAHILLIVEMLLSEDEKPVKTKWLPPKDDSDAVMPLVFEADEPSVPQEERLQLLDAILDILPRIGKDESLALAVLRILVVLTRVRSVALVMGEKKNIQRLFVMAKQLAGASSARIQSPLMLILRHIIEDDETVRQIMRAEIKSFFENNRQARSMDEKHFLRGMAHTALRNPQLFISVANEMVKLTRWHYPSPEQPRPGILVLKDKTSQTTGKSSKSSDESVQPAVQGTEDLSIQDVKPSTEVVDSEMPDAPKPGSLEQKLPVVENPDGVIHFLLCELLNYKDVEDKDPVSANLTSVDKTLLNTTNTPVPGTASPSDSTISKPLKPVSKAEFKAEEHPIYIYRCFILQCLTELLSSYNRTKIEFINFKRSAPPQAMTPSKPRSSVVNYLLFDLIPIGTLEHAESTNLRKRTVTSSWADSVLTALLSKTGEQPIDKEREPYDSENEPDLQFVRRFVLENILKAYKDATYSNETLDSKYSRLLALAELMSHIMGGKENVGMSDTSTASTSQKQLRRIMFEKGFVSALTASIADIDLDFPNAKRAVKYILRPLKTLTTTAVALSDLALVSSTPGQNDEDEIESATSISDPEEDREETPDLFRNSTLGMFEPGREEDSSSESDDDDDEEMYEAEYGEEMEYGDDDPGDDEDNISDEDEDIEGMGPIEGLSGDHAVDVEVIMDDDDDDEDDDGSSDEDDDEDDEDDEHEMEDDDARVEIIDEAGHIQQLDEEDMMGEWESDDEGEDDEEEDFEAQAADQEEEQIQAMGGPLGHLVRVLNGDDEAADMIDRMEAEGLGEGGEEDDEEDERIGAEFGEEGDEDDEEEDEEMDEEDMIFGQYPMDGPGAVSFGWQDDVDPPAIVSRRSRGGGFSPFPFIPGGRHDPLGGMLLSLAEMHTLSATLGLSRTNPPTVPDYRSSYRSHRPGAPNPRLTDDGTNPLLQRSGPGGSGREVSARGPSMGSWIRAAGHPGAELLDIGLGQSPFGESWSLQNRLLRSLQPLPGHITRNGQALQFQITTGPGHAMPPDLQQLLAMGRPRYESRRDAAEPGSAAFFTPQSTSARWLEESKIIFSINYLERANDLVNSLSAILIPPALEVEKAIRAAEAEKAQRAQEEAKKKAEEERIAKEAKEAEEKIAREKKEAEEREAAEQAAAEALAARDLEADQVEDGHTDSTEAAPDAMEGVESGTPTANEQNDGASAADQPRVTTMIRGNPYDITDLGIDPTFLAELPEELREEVIMSAVAERRIQATARGSQPSEIDQEFLAALPDDIRDEIIQQERQDRRRREREERNRAAAAANGGGVAAAQELNAAEILASMPPALRHQVLLEQNEETLRLLPPEIAEQARAAMRDHPAHGRVPSGLRRAIPPGEPQDVNAQRMQKHPTVQMLDKSGVATLLRLMFILQHGSLRSTLNSVLQNVCLNRHNRTEVLGILLHILQDGSIDMTAIDRSFAHLSLKAKQPKDAQSKTPQPLKRVLTGTNPITSGTLEASPLLLVQQCLSALVYLTQVNPHTPAFFLAEHDNASASKRNLSRKGKAKDNKAGKYALNSLLGLLDRDLIMESSSVMESLSTLLNMITSPLQALQRKQKEAEVEEKAETNQQEGTPSVIENNGSVASPGTESSSTHNEQTAASEANPSTEVAMVDTAAIPDMTANASEQPTIVEGETSTAKIAGKEPEKKTRNITPPVIPEHNLQLVINIFVARECSSKTFRETLSTIKNLSAIPGAKVVFGRELIAKAQGLGEVILIDLEDLLPQIQKASTGTEIQGVALAKFSPGSSDQNKLLRVLTALDHLFDPKREKLDKPSESDEGESSQLMEKQDLLSSLYDNPTFGRMWDKLSACLAVIRQREHMLNVATILLPLIEALMVVCKNTTLKDAPLARSQGKDMVLTSPPPESRMESLFFTFTEEHRKILNDLVRHTPKLMSGTFSLLVKNPKVLEFDNKRNYFSRSIHSKAPNGRQSFPPLQISVRRDQVFHDSFKSLYFQTGDQMKYGKLSIRFHGEEGVDAGGVTREWFQVLARQMFDPGYALFIPVSSDRTTFHPNQLSSINEEHLMFFKFIGRIIGKALYENRVLDCHFSRAVYKRILGKAVSVKDMESLDPDYYKSLVWMLENDITDIITETFSVDNDKFGVVETIDFIPNGRTIAVTEENKHEYVRLMVEWKLTGSVKGQLDEFLKGFHEIISADLVAIFNEQELELLISGLPEIDVDDWKSNTEYHNYTASSPQIQWFWRAIRSYDKEERAKLLQFVTGTSKVPLNGFKELEGMNGFSRFNIHRDYGNKDRLPSSHTCFNQLDLPEYESYEALRQQVLTAITAGSEYFGFA